MKSSSGFAASLPRSVLVRRLSHGVVDMPLLLLLLAIVALGLVVLYSALGGELDRLDGHAIRMGVALIGMLVAAQLRPRLIFRFTPFAYLGSVLLLIATLIVGLEANNSKSWLGIPGVFSFQPSELAKVSVVLFVAWYLSHRPYPLRLLDLVAVGGIAGLASFLVYLQGDLGTAVLIVAPVGAMLLVVGLRIVWIVVGMLVAVAASPLVWLYLDPHQKGRILTFLDPYHDPLGLGYNIIQSWIAIGSGGLHGKGLMKGTQSRLKFLPEHHTDFILAVIGEELGLILTACVLLAFFSVFARCLYIATRATEVFERLAVTGIALMFFCNVLVNVGMVLGLMPVVGVPLPLISYGGSSAVTMLAGFGLIMAMNKDRSRWQRA